jgi:hypothetical protein
MVMEETPVIELQAAFTQDSGGDMALHTEISPDDVLQANEQAIVQPVVGPDTDSMDVDQPDTASPSPPTSPLPIDAIHVSLAETSHAVNVALLAATIAAIELDFTEDLEREALEKHKITMVRGCAAGNVVMAAVAIANVARIAAAEAPVTALQDAVIAAEGTVASMAKIVAVVVVEIEITQGKAKEMTAAREIAEVHARECGTTAVLAIEKARIAKQAFTGADESEDGAVINDNSDNGEGMTPEASGTPDNARKRAVNAIAPTTPAAHAALEAITHELKPKWKSGKGHTDPGLDLLTHNRLELMKSCLWMFVDPTDGKSWIAASQHAVHAAQHGPYFAKKL